jgi:hypothetical protein
MNTRTPIALLVTLHLSLGLLPAGCSDKTPDMSPPAARRAVIVAGDFTEGHPGILSTLDLESRTVTMNAGPALAVGADPLLRHIGSELVIVNRVENNITILDDQTLALKEQIGVGAGSNPQDVAVLGNQLYVATFGGTGLTVLTRGSIATTAIDLPADDPDGEPNCASIFLVGRTLYVACELLDDTFKPRDLGKVYIVDTATNTVKPALTVTLARANPFGLFEQIPDGAPHAGDLLITTVGDFTPATGCVERVATGAAPSAAGCVLEHAAVGGYVTRVAFEVDTGVAMMWSAVGLPAPDPPFVAGDLRGYDLMTSTLWADPLNPRSESIVDVVHCSSGEVVVVDATTNANGLRIYANAAEQTTAALPIGLGSFSSHGLVCY